MQKVCSKCGFDGADEENRNAQITLTLLKIPLLLSLLYLPLFVPMSIIYCVFYFRSCRRFCPLCNSVYLD